MRSSYHILENLRLNVPKNGSERKTPFTKIAFYENVSDLDLASISAWHSAISPKKSKSLLPTEHTVCGLAIKIQQTAVQSCTDIERATAEWVFVQKLSLLKDCTSCGLLLMNVMGTVGYYTDT
jgi:hypothetical protein